ncbi:unnamed protein product [Peniophora sp. CBMAI 1063]|nr:unnamed protein product [Peniophora sp. CBMAI 1063]
MELHFMNEDILNTIARDHHSKPIFRIATSSALVPINRTTTISRFEPAAHADTKLDEVSKTAAVEEDADLDQYEEHVVAQIVWHGMKQSVFKFAGEEVSLKVDEYLPPTSMMKRRRILNSSRGDAYQWASDEQHCWLEEAPSRPSSKGVTVAKFHKSVAGLRQNCKHPRLDLDQSLLPILDEVIVSFIWCERRRTEREVKSAIGSLSQHL